MTKQVTIRMSRREAQVVVDALRRESGDCTRCERHDPIRAAAEKIARELEAGTITGRVAAQG